MSLSLCYVDFSFRYARLSLCHVSASLCSVIVSLHYGNLFLLYISLSFRYVGL